MQNFEQKGGDLIWRELGLNAYEPIWAKMRQFVANANAQTVEEIWLLEHERIFTLGQAGKREHILNAGDIPVIQTERGGQVTYHGQGQLVVYFMLDLKRRHLSVRDLVSLLENAVIELLAQYQIAAFSKKDAPGIYVDHKKIASLGLRIRRGWSFHGLALNVKMDLEPFLRINPCGYQGLQMTQIAEFVPQIDLKDVSLKLQTIFNNHLAYF